MSELFDYVNSIVVFKMFDLDSGTDKLCWSFHGDGCGDFEEIADDASDKLLEEYIKDCESQIKYAKQYIKERNKNCNGYEL